MQKKTFTNTRTRFQRISDAKLFSGWIRKFGRSMFMVTLSREAAVSPGEEFAFQAFGHGTLGVFRGILTLVSGYDLTFSYSSEVQLQKSKEEMRLLVEGMTGSMCYRGCETD